MSGVFADSPSYSDVVRFFESLIDYEKGRPARFRTETREADLDRFRKLLRELGSPQFCAPAFHIAGTKGKGSTCALLASILHDAGLRVGLYTSPHIETYCERIRIDGELIAESRFAKLIASLAPMVEPQVRGAGEGFRTVFELLTASAFAYFRDQQVNALVIETGLGGRLDATNVFYEANSEQSVPLVNIITSVGLDHTEILGDTIENIAAEKAGIIGPHATVVVGPQQPQYERAVRTIVEQRAQSVGCQRLLFVEELLTVTPLPEVVASVSLGRARGKFALTKKGREVFSKSSLGDALKNGLVVETGLPGFHQLDNLRTSLVALLAAEQRGVATLSAHDVQKGASSVSWPGRFEIMSTNPPVVVDGAHCELSARAMARTYRQLWGTRPAHVVLGLMQDKALSRILEGTRGTLPAARYYCCAPPSPRGRSASEVSAEVKEQLKIASEAFASPEDAIAAAWHSARRDGGSVVAFGSFYLVAPYKAALRSLLPSREK